MARTVSQFCIAMFILATAFHSTRSQDIPAVHIEPAWQVPSIEYAPLTYTNDGQCYLTSTKEGEVAVHDIKGSKVLFHRKCILLGVDRQRETFWIPGQYAIEEYSYRSGVRLDSIPCPTWPQSVGVQYGGSKVLLSDYRSLYVHDRSNGSWDTVITGLDLATAGFVHRELPLIAWTQYAPIDPQNPYRQRTFDLHLYWTESGRHDSIPADGLLAEDWASNYIRNGHNLVNIHTLREYVGTCTPDQRYIATVKGPNQYHDGYLDLIELASGDTIGRKLGNGQIDEPPDIVVALGDTVYFFDLHRQTSYMYCWSIPDSSMRRVAVHIPDVRGTDSDVLQVGYRGDSVIIVGTKDYGGDDFHIRPSRHLLIPSMTDVTPSVAHRPWLAHQFSSDGSILVDESRFNVINSSGVLGYKPVTGASPKHIVGIVSERPQLLTIYWESTPIPRSYIYQYGDPPTRSDTMRPTAETSYQFDIVRVPGDTTLLCGRRILKSLDEVFGLCYVPPDIDRRVLTDVEYSLLRDTVFGLSTSGIDVITRDLSYRPSIKSYSFANNANWDLNHFYRLATGDRFLCTSSSYSGSVLIIVGLNTPLELIRWRSDSVSISIVSVAANSAKSLFIATKLNPHRREVLHEVFNDTLGIVERIYGLTDTVVAWFEDTVVIARFGDEIHRRGLHGITLGTWRSSSPIRECWRPDNSSAFMILTDDNLYSLNKDLTVRDSMRIRLFTDSSSHKTLRYLRSDIDSNRVLVRVDVPVDPYAWNNASEGQIVLAVLDLRDHSIHPILPIDNNVMNIYNAHSTSLPFGLSQSAYVSRVEVYGGKVLYVVVDLTTHKPIAITSPMTLWFAGTDTILSFHWYDHRGPISPIRRPALGILGCIIPEAIQYYPAKQVALSASKQQDLILVDTTINNVRYSSMRTRDLSSLQIFDEVIVPDSIFLPWSNFNNLDRNLIVMSEDGSAWAGACDSGGLYYRDAHNRFSFTVRNIGYLQGLLFNITGDTLFCATTAQGVLALPVPTLDAVSVHPLQHYGRCEITCTALNDFGVRLSGLRERVSTFIVDMNGKEVQHTTTFQPSADGDAALIEVPSHASTLIMHVRSESCATYFVLFPDGTIGTPVK